MQVNLLLSMWPVTVLNEDDQITTQKDLNSKKWGTVTNDEVNKLYEEEWKKFFILEKIMSHVYLWKITKLKKWLT